MKRGIEAGNRGGVRQRRRDRIERGDRFGLVQRREVDQAAQCGLDVSVDQHGVVKPLTAVHDPVSDHVGAVESRRPDLVAQLRRVDGRSRRVQLRGRDGPVASVQQGQLDRARPRVDDEDVQNSLRSDSIVLAT
jgi:hypothetical protein